MLNYFYILLHSFISCHRYGDRKVIMNQHRSKLSLFLISVLMGFCGLAIPGLSASTIARIRLNVFPIFIFIPFLILDF